MAAAPVAPMDLKSTATFPIRLGNSILKPAESKKFATVRYNHKPRLDPKKNVQCSIKPNAASRDEELSMRDGDREYSYSGRRSNGQDQYVLFSKGSGKDRYVVLEKVEGIYGFNLIQTPSVNDASKLAERYPHLTEEEGDADDLFGDGGDIEAPRDPSNPFDYRNHLKPDSTKAKDVDKDATRSSAHTPVVQPRPASTTPHSRPTKRPDGPLVSQKKRKVQDTSKTNPKRVKAGTEPPPTIPPSSAKPRPKTDVPRVQVRKPTIRRASLDDSGELVLENETPVTDKPPNRSNAMSLALSGQLGQGPISLHSAASSPASRIASPMPPRPEGMEEGEEFELGGSISPEAPVKKQQQQQQAPGQDDGDDEDADADVEDLELPSPVQAHRESVGNAPAAAAADEEDDLDKQLALAMAEDDDGDVPPAAPPAESDEESEEE